MQPKRLRVEFTGAFGNRIAARLDEPADTPKACAIFAHCFTCGKDLKAANWISRELVDRRIAVLRFDFTGLGESEGEFADTNFSTNVADLLAAADYLREKGRAPQILIGHSLGGAAVLVAGREIPEVRAVATIAAPANTTQLRDLLARQAPEIMDTGEAMVDVMGHRVRIKKQMLEDFGRHEPQDAARQLGKPLLVFHSPIDDISDIRNAHQIFEAAAHPKSFIALDGADHLLIARERDARFVAEMLATWVQRYLATPEDNPSA